MSNNDDNRRRQAMSVESFAHRKGVTKAIQSFRERKERKFVHTAKNLRAYRKVMKREGFEPGRGASRKRGEEVVGKRVKSNPLEKVQKKAEERKQDVEAKQKAKEQGEIDRQRKLEERKKRTVKLRQRTKKGQPVMKNIVHDILHKLEKEDA